MDIHKYLLRNGLWRLAKILIFRRKIEDCRYNMLAKFEPVKILLILNHFFHRGAPCHFCLNSNAFSANVSVKPNPHSVRCTRSTDYYSSGAWSHWHSVDSADSPLISVTSSQTSSIRNHIPESRIHPAHRDSRVTWELGRKKKREKNERRRSPVGPRETLKPVKEARGSGVFRKA